MRLLLTAWMAVVVGVLSACAGENGPGVDRVGLQRLDVRDGVIGDLSGTGLDGTGVAADDAGTDSLSVFKRTVHPKLVAWCSSCHATNQSPLFAHADPAVAHEAVLAAQKVDFQDTARSRLVLRLTEENHNCPADGCAEAGSEVLSAIDAWGAALAVDDVPVVGGLVTPPLALADAATKRIGGDNPPGVLRVEAESSTFKAPMAALLVAGSSAGSVAQTPAGAGSQNNQQTAAQSNTLGTVIYDLDVKTAGTYRLHGLVNAPTAMNNAFWVRMDAGNFLGWQIPANGAQYTWDLADTNVDMGTTLQFNLAAGAHRLELRQREEQTKVDVLVLASDATFNPADAKPPFRDVSVLTFDLAGILGVAGAKLTIEALDYSENAYLFKNPTLDVPGGKVRVKNLKLLINGVFLPQHATYTVVDQTVAAPGALLSSASLVALKDKGPAVDEFQILFEVLEVAP